MLERVADPGLLKGKTVGIDTTALEANAALRSIVRRGTCEGYGPFLRGLAAESGIPRPTRAELTRLDRKPREKGSNQDWMHLKDPDAKIARIKDGRTHLDHRAEHAADRETGAVVAITVQDASAGDTMTMVKTLITAGKHVEAVLAEHGGLAEVVAGKGYHSNETMVALAELGLRSYVSELDRGRRRRGKHAARETVHAIRWPRRRRLLRQRDERLERPNTHLYETGRLRRVYLRGYANIRERLLVHACGLNGGLLMRRLTGGGTPRSLQGRASALFNALERTLTRFWRLVSCSEALMRRRPLGPPRTGTTLLSHQRLSFALQRTAFPTDC